MSVDRRELVRAYKETRRPMGIFRVRHVESGRALIGASTDIPSILNRHRVQLKLNGHPNAELQRDWNTFGADAFAFETVDLLTAPDDVPDYDPADDLRALEAMWLAELQPFAERGYNRVKRRS